MTTDKRLVGERFGSGFRTYDKLAVVQQQICDELAGMCRRYVDCAPRSAIEVGVGTGFLTRRLVEMYPAARWTLNDITDKASAFVVRYIGGIDSSYLWGDAETIPFPGEVDMVVSASTVQWFDNLPSFVVKAAASTLEGGYLVLSTFGPENFREVSAVAHEGLAYYSRAELEDMVAAAGYDVLHSDDYTRTLLFASPSDVLHHIKATGVNSVSGTRWTRGRLASFDNDYRARFAIADGRVTLTYHPVFLIARKK